MLLTFRQPLLPLSKQNGKIFLFSSDAVLRQHASCALRDNADVGYRVPLLRRVAVCSYGPLISCRHWSRLMVPCDVPSDEVFAKAIRSIHFLQMCLLGPFGVLCATMKIDSVKNCSETTHFVSNRMVATEV